MIIALILFTGWMDLTSSIDFIGVTDLMSCDVVKVQSIYFESFELYYPQTVQSPQTCIFSLLSLGSLILKKRELCVPIISF